MITKYESAFTGLKIDELLKKINDSQIFTQEEKTKLENIEDGAEVNLDQDSFNVTFNEETDSLKNTMVSIKDYVDTKNKTNFIKPTSYFKGDCWILESDQTINGKTYLKGEKLYASTSSASFVESHWNDYSFFESNLSNMLNYSKNGINITSRDYGDNTKSTLDVYLDENDFKVTTLSANNETSLERYYTYTSFGVSNSRLTRKLNKDVQYVFSFNYKSTGDNRIEISGNSITSQCNLINDDTWRRGHIILNYTVDVDLIYLRLNVENTSTNNISISEITLTEGSIGTSGWIDSINKLFSDYNLLESSDKVITTDSYLMNSYKIASEIITNEFVTITLSGELSENKDYFSIYNGASLIGILYPYEFKNGIATKTLKFNNIGNDNLLIYSHPQAVVETNTINWIKLTRGTESSKQWTPGKAESFGSEENINNLISNSSPFSQNMLYNSLLPKLGSSGAGISSDGYITTSNKVTFFENLLKYSQFIPSGSEITISIRCKAQVSGGSMSVYLNSSNSYLPFDKEVSTSWQVLHCTRTLNYGITSIDKIHINPQWVSDSNLLQIHWISLNVGSQKSEVWEECSYEINELNKTHLVKPTIYNAGDSWKLTEDVILAGKLFFKGELLISNNSRSIFTETDWNRSNVLNIGSKNLFKNSDTRLMLSSRDSGVNLESNIDFYNEFEFKTTKLSANTSSTATKFYSWKILDINSIEDILQEQLIPNTNYCLSFKYKGTNGKIGCKSSSMSYVYTNSLIYDNTWHTGYINFTTPNISDSLSISMEIDNVTNSELSVNKFKLVEGNSTLNEWNDNISTKDLNTSPENHLLFSRVPVYNSVNAAIENKSSFTSTYLSPTPFSRFYQSDDDLADCDVVVSIKCRADVGGELLNYLNSSNSYLPFDKEVTSEWQILHCKRKLTGKLIGDVSNSQDRFHLRPGYSNDWFAEDNKLYIEWITLRKGNILIDEWTPNKNDSVFSDYNLLKNSNVSVSNNSYLLNTYYFDNDSILNNWDEVTITLNGYLGDDKTQLMIYDMVGSKTHCIFTANDFKQGVISKTFRWNKYENNTGFRVYAYPNTGTSTSAVNWIKLVKGGSTSNQWTTGSLIDYATKQYVDNLIGDINAVLDNINGEVI